MAVKLWMWRITHGKEYGNIKGEFRTKAGRNPPSRGQVEKVYVADKAN